MYYGATVHYFFKFPVWRRVELPLRPAQTIAMNMKVV
jgi:hypothetical protein